MEQPLILLSNDDGVEAPGLEALSGALEATGAEVWIVAPAGERSTSSHALTLHRPVAVKALARRRYAVDGWPADCVYLALFALLPRRPALVISGINAGANLGTDVLYSGTVGAAREAFTRGIPAMAVSLVTGDDYTLAARFTRRLAEVILASAVPPLLLNVNVPGSSAAGVRVARLGERCYPERGEPSGERDGWTLYRIGGGLLADALLPGSDGEAVDQGLIAVTPLSIDSTAVAALPIVEGLSLSEAFARSLDPAVPRDRPSPTASARGRGDEVSDHD